MNEVLSDQQHGGFYASQDADKRSTTTATISPGRSRRFAPCSPPKKSRVIEMYYDVEPHGEMHHNPAKNVLWVRATDRRHRPPIESRAKTSARMILARAKGKMLEARANAGPRPAIDYDALRQLERHVRLRLSGSRRVLGPRGLPRFCAEDARPYSRRSWDEAQGFLHRVGGPRLEGTLDDQVFGAAALLDAYETTLDPRYFDRRRARDETRDRKISATRSAAASSIAPPTPPRWAASKFAASPSRIRPRREQIPWPQWFSTAFTVHWRTRSIAIGREKTLEAFAGSAPQFGLFAATYGLAALLHARHGLQVVVTGASGDPQAAALEQAATSVYRFGKSVLRVTPENLSDGALPPALKETIPHLQADLAQAFVCIGTTCQPPVTDVGKLKALLVDVASTAAAQG